MIYFTIETRDVDRMMYFGFCDQDDFDKMIQVLNKTETDRIEFSDGVDVVWVDPDKITEEILDVLEMAGVPESVAKEGIYEICTILLVDAPYKTAFSAGNIV